MQPERLEIRFGALTPADQYKLLTQSGDNALKRRDFEYATRQYKAARKLAKDLYKQDPGQLNRSLGLLSYREAVVNLLKLRPDDDDDSSRQLMRQIRAVTKSITAMHTYFNQALEQLNVPSDEPTKRQLYGPMLRALSLGLRMLPRIEGLTAGKSQIMESFKLMQRIHQQLGLRREYAVPEDMLGDTQYKDAIQSAKVEDELSQPARALEYYEAALYRAILLSLSNRDNISIPTVENFLTARVIEYKARLKQDFINDLSDFRSVAGYVAGNPLQPEGALEMLTCTDDVLAMAMQADKKSHVTQLTRAYAVFELPLRWLHEKLGFTDLSLPDQKGEFQLA